MSEIQRLDYVPSDMRMNYGPVLKKDNPLIASWVAAVKDLPSDKKEDSPKSAPNEMQVLMSIISLLNTLVARFFKGDGDDDEDDEVKPKE